MNTDASNGKPLVSAWLVGAAALLFAGTLGLSTRGVLEETAAPSPDHSLMHYQLARFQLLTSQAERAVENFQRAIAKAPDSGGAHTGLGTALAALGRYDEARSSLEAALRLEPGDSEAQRSLGYVLMQKGLIAEACEIYRASLEQSPNDVSALNNLAWMLATAEAAGHRDGAQAVGYARRAVEASGMEHPTLLMTLAAAHAEAGQFAEAVNAAERALELARASSNSALEQSLRVQLEAYRSGRPLRAP